MLGSWSSVTTAVMVQYSVLPLCAPIHLIIQNDKTMLFWITAMTHILITLLRVLNVRVIQRTHICTGISLLFHFFQQQYFYFSNYLCLAAASICGLLAGFFEALMTSYPFFTLKIKKAAAATAVIQRMTGRFSLNSFLQFVQLYSALQRQQLTSCQLVFSVVLHVSLDALQLLSHDKHTQTQLAWILRVLLFMVSYNQYCYPVCLPVL